MTPRTSIEVNQSPDDVAESTLEDPAIEAIAEINRHLHGQCMFPNPGEDAIQAVTSRFTVDIEPTKVPGYLSVFVISPYCDLWVEVACNCGQGSKLLLPLPPSGVLELELTPNDLYQVQISRNQAPRAT